MKCDICGEIIDHQGCCPDGCTNCPIYGNRNSVENTEEVGCADIL